MPVQSRLGLGRPRRVASALASALVAVGLIAIVVLASGASPVRPLTRLASPAVSPVAVIDPTAVPTSGMEHEKGAQPTRAPTPEPTPTPAIFMGWPTGVVIDVPSTATPSPTPTEPPPTDGAKIADTEGLKAVVIVGPTSEETATNLIRGEEFAQRAEANGMEVRRVFFPHATWKNVLANIQGANLVAYFGHGNGWPSMYGSFQESTKDGFGLDTVDGGAESDTTYYGGSLIRRSIKLAPNAVVVLSHLCYSAGNAEPGLPIPTEDIAWQRVDNYAGAFLAVGARAVFALGTGDASTIVDGLFARERTMDDIFMIRGRGKRPYYGFVGWQDHYFDSHRSPGYRNHLDPGEIEGFLRAITGDLEMTTTDWAAGNSASPTPSR
jgi:hypothetical protein